MKKSDAQEALILLANVMDYFSDLDDDGIEALIPNLIRFLVRISKEN